MDFDKYFTARRFSRICGWVILLISVATIVGYIFRVRWLYDPVLGPYGMSFLTAVCFLLLALQTLYLFRLRDQERPE